MPDILKRRYNFVEFGEGGRIDKLYCKVCGTQIAGTVERPRAAQGPGANQYVEKYMRFPTYCEAKFGLSRMATVIEETTVGKGKKATKAMLPTIVRVIGGYHITHGCKECLKMDMDLALAQELYITDLQEQGQGPLYEERVEAVVTIDHTGSGMV